MRIEQGNYVHCDAHPGGACSSGGRIARPRARLWFTDDVDGGDTRVVQVCDRGLRELRAALDAIEEDADGGPRNAAIDLMAKRAEPPRAGDLVAIGADGGVRRTTPVDVSMGDVIGTATSDPDPDGSVDVVFAVDRRIVRTRVVDPTMHHSIETRLGELEQIARELGREVEIAIDVGDPAGADAMLVALEAVDAAANALRAARAGRSWLMRASDPA